MKRLCIFIVIAFVFLYGCDKAGTNADIVGESLDSGSVDLSQSVIIANSLAETLSVLDDNGAIHNNVQVTGAAPNSILYETPYVYVINSQSNSVLVLNEKDLSIAGEISVGTNKNPMYAAVAGEHILAVSGFISQTLDILDTSQKKVTSSIDLSAITLPCDVAGIAGKSYPQGVAVTEGRIFVALSNLTDYYGGLTAAGSGVVAVFDAATLESLGTVVLEGADPVDVKAVGGKVIVACAGHYEGDITKPQSKGFKGDGTIEIIDAASLGLDKSYHLSAAPFSFSVSSSGIIYATNAMGGNIPEIDLATGDISYLNLASAFISSVLSVDGMLYALDFSNDRLYVLNSGGTVQTQYTVGDGPIAMLSIAQVTAGNYIIPKLSINPVPAPAGAEVTFDASESLVPDGSYVFTWDFGDGRTAAGETVKHAYDEVGEYPVTLTISGEKGTASSSPLPVMIVKNSPFASSVISFSPAPGQFFNDPQYNDPDKALGRPYGGTNPYVPDNSSIVSLGGFGGFITLAFDHEVINNPDGPDFIVYGNAMYAPYPIRWIQPGIVEISRDNVSWYLIAGSSLEGSPGSPAYARVEKYYAETGQTMSAYKLPSTLADNIADNKYLIWGYANLSPVLALPSGADPLVFYTTPDNPFNIGIDPGTGGGDAFDIEWAVDPITGEKAHLAGFRYIRITTAIDAQHGNGLGEYRTNIDAVADIGIE